MLININNDPPTDIPQLRWKYTIASLLFLGLVVCAVILGVFSVVFSTGYDDILQNTAFALFVAAGFAFVYFTEKLMGFRRPGPKRQEKLTAMMYDHKAVSEYCRAMFLSGGIEVVPWLRGRIDCVIDAYINSGLNDTNFTMPGCCGQRRRGRGGKGRRFDNGRNNRR